MGLANKVFYKHMDWETVVNFVIRLAMTEAGSIESYKLKMNYQKLMALVWMLAVLVLTQSYAGNLTSMLTRPIIRKTINNVEDLVNQTEIKWANVDEGAEIYEYLNSTPSGTTMRRLFDQAETGSDLESETHAQIPCYTLEQQIDGTWASICDVNDIDRLKSHDFGVTGKCNYYTIDDTFFTTPAVMAFQVGHH